MATLPEINAERDAAIALLDNKIVAANDLKNRGAPGMDAVIDSLSDQQAEITAQAYAAALDDPSMTRALATLRQATAEMNTVAANMNSATSFITNIASLGTAANKVVAALKG